MPLPPRTPSPSLPTRAGADYPGTSRTWRLGDPTLVELQELAACGLSPLEALTAATQVNAAA